MNANEFKQRREQLMAEVGKGNIAIIASANTRTRNRDVDYPFVKIVILLSHWF